ncbi:hypothetical protein FOZ76_13115 [Verticiella sediminum]|uniref:Ubiquinone biosynthesis accessory factor UbiJ n=1 Tax=Verticiella sediminum TaxID=1247510 RepID=A0A556ALT5_9BURK|nr:SCP2 sterol-binding domain-containing protein [Verticiella sediminum]TSH93825.1 hypothetical protein FOZ76_13115 [Verticiella sediminum]
MPLPLPSSVATRVINALLAREPWASERLRPHAGKTVRVSAGALDVALRIRPEGRVEPSPGGAPNVTVRVDTIELPRLVAADPAQRMGALHVEGEAALAQVAAELARDLRWDGEDELARRIGDLPARLLTRFVATALGLARESASRLAQNASEYVTYEAQLLASPPAVDAWRREATELEARVDALEARLDAYARSRGERA